MVQQSTGDIIKTLPTTPLPVNANNHLKFMALVSFFSPRRQIIIVVGLSELLSSLSDPFLILVTHANLTAAD